MNMYKQTEFGRIFSAITAVMLSALFVAAAVGPATDTTAVTTAAAWLAA